MFREKTIPRHLLLVILFILCIAVTFAGTLTPVDEGTAEGIAEESKEMSEEIRSDPWMGMRYIFGNNFMHCLIMFVPGVGVAYGFFVMYSTGFVIETLALSEGVNPQLYLALLFIFPFAWMEYLAYSIAMTESTYLVIGIIEGKFRQELSKTYKWITLCAIILLLAALVEILFIIWM